MIAGDAEAIAIARQLAAEFAKGDSERDRKRRLPYDEVKKFSASGLWGVTVPKEYGGALSFTDVRTRLQKSGDECVLNGHKHYCCGVLLADWIPVIAANDEGKTAIAFVERDAQGLTLLDDWTSFGQRTTASGTTILENVKVKPEHVIPYYLDYFVRNHTRPWIDSNVEYGFEDSLSVYNFGNVQTQVHAALDLAVTCR